MHPLAVIAWTALAGEAALTIGACVYAARLVRAEVRTTIAERRHRRNA